MSQPLLKVSNLSVSLPGHASRALAVQNISFDIRRGETLCLVGESGSGKSVVAHSILGLLPRALAITSGAIDWQGRDIAHLGEQQMRLLRGREISMVFQEPGTALNPLATTGAQVREAIAMHDPQRATREAVAQALAAVALLSI
jgi:peptide/nickel transport system ATP-binding protein